MTINQINGYQYTTSMVINILHNRNHKYSSYNNNIKYVNSIIKCIIFESIYYDINLDLISSCMIFINFDFIFLLIYYYFELIKLFFSSKKYFMDLDKSYN